MERIDNATNEPANTPEERQARKEECLKKVTKVKTDFEAAHPSMCSEYTGSVLDTRKIVRLAKSGEIDAKSFSEAVVRDVLNGKLRESGVIAAMENIVYYEGAFVPAAEKLCREAFSRETATTDMKNIVLDGLLADDYWQGRYEEVMGRIARRHQQDCTSWCDV